MSEALTPAPASASGRAEIAPRGGAAVALPAVIVDAGPAAVERFLEFFAAAIASSFAARIANRRTRAAYGRAVGQFLAWCEARGLGTRGGLAAARGGLHPDAPWVGAHGQAALGSDPHARRLARRQPGPSRSTPAAAVRGPKHVVTKGATPVLSPAEARRLLEATDKGTLAGLRDRALLSVMLYSFARVSAVVAMRRADYFWQESRGWLRLHEKGGKRHDVPAHHRAAEALDHYLEAGGLGEAKAPLFQSVDPAGRRLTGRALSRRLVLAMIKRRAAAAELLASTCCHTFRATGITAYLSNGGSRVEGRRVAGRASVADPALSHRAAIRGPWARFLPPLSEPGVPISGTGLSSGIMRLAHGLSGRGERSGVASRGTAARTLAPAGRCVVRPVDALTTATARVVPFACACDDVRHCCSSPGY